MQIEDSKQDKRKPQSDINLDGRNQNQGMQIINLDQDLNKKNKEEKKKIDDELKESLKKTQEIHNLTTKFVEGIKNPELQKIKKEQLTSFITHFNKRLINDLNYCGIFPNKIIPKNEEIAFSNEKNENFRLLNKIKGYISDYEKNHYSSKMYIIPAEMLKLLYEIFDYSKWRNGFPSQSGTLSKLINTKKFFYFSFAFGVCSIVLGGILPFVFLSWYGLGIFLPALVIIAISFWVSYEGLKGIRSKNASKIILYQMILDLSKEIEKLEKGEDKDNIKKLLVDILLEMRKFLPKELSRILSKENQKADLGLYEKIVKASKDFRDKKRRCLGKWLFWNGKDKISPSPEKVFSSKGCCDALLEDVIQGKMIEEDKIQEQQNIQQENQNTEEKFLEKDNKLQNINLNLNNNNNNQDLNEKIKEPNVNNSEQQRNFSLESNSISKKSLLSKKRQDRQDKWNQLKIISKQNQINQEQDKIQEQQNVEQKNPNFFNEDEKNKTLNSQQNFISPNRGGGELINAQFNVPESQKNQTDQDQDLQVINLEEEKTPKVSEAESKRRTRIHDQLRKNSDLSFLSYKQQKQILGSKINQQTPFRQTFLKPQVGNFVKIVSPKVDNFMNEKNDVLLLSDIE